jgi:hypothetical protein
LIKKIVIIVLALAALTSVSTAQYNTTTQAYPNIPDGPDADNAPTDTRPQAGAQPQTPPEVSTGETASELGQGQPLTEEQVSSFGQVEETGAAQATALVGGTAPAGLQYRILYNGYWSYGPAALNYGQQNNMLVSIDQPQNIWSYEEYPGGYEVWKQWGYWYPGDYNTWFYGDASGWHLVAIYGETSGWSNAVWIYVEPGSPYTVNGSPQPVFTDMGQTPAQEPPSEEPEEEDTQASDVGEIEP